MTFNSKEMLVLFIAMILPVLLAQDYLIMNNEEPKTYSENYTATGISCEEFVNNTSFDPSSIVDIDWKIFYLWNFHTDDSYNIRFTVPTESLLERFSMVLSKEYPTINWTDGVLFMETTINFSGLFVKTNTSGILYLISFDALEHVIPISTMKYGFKLVDGYLGIETCSVKLCIALASIGKRPPDDKLEETASRFGFRSDFNTSLFLNYTTRSPVPSPVEQTHDENEEDYDMENDPGDKQFIF